MMKRTIKKMNICSNLNHYIKHIKILLNFQRINQDKQMKNLINQVLNLIERNLNLKILKIKQNNILSLIQQLIFNYNFFSIQEQKKDIEQEVEYLKNQRRDLLEIKESLQNQVDNLTQENERLQTAIYQKSQELRTSKTKRYSQISIDSCFSEQNHKGTTMEDFTEMMSIKKEKFTQTFDHDKITISTSIQTDIKFIFHQGTQTGLQNDDDNYQTHNSENNDQFKRLLDQKYDLEEKLKLSNNIISDLQKTKQHLMREQEVNTHKLASQEISLTALQKEIERLQSELQSLLQSRQQKKRTIVSLEENNGDYNKIILFTLQMSLGPIREQQKTPSNTLEKLVDKNGMNNNQKTKQQNQIQQQDNSIKNGKNDKIEKNQGSNFTSNNASQNNSQNQTPLNKELSNNTASKLQTQNQNNQQQQGKLTLHQKKPSDNQKSTSHNINQNYKQTKLQNNKKPNSEQINNQSNIQQNNQINQGVQKLKYDTNQLGQVEKCLESSNKEQDQLNSSQIRNTLLNLNEVNNEDEQFGDDNLIEQNNQNEYPFKRSSTKKLSYKFNNSQPNSQNTSVYVNQIQRKGSYLTPAAPEAKTIRDKEQQLKETALEFIKQFIQTINLQHPENIEQTMLLQNVFKLITQFYKERLEKKQPIYVICYEFYMNTFGLKQIAENKLTMLCQAVVFYKNIPRVKLFSRFLQIQDAINDEDLDFYFSTLQHLDIQQKPENLISCTQNQECVLILYDKALDQLASLDEHLIEIQSKFKSQIQIINGNRYIDLDLFFMESLQLFQLMKKIHQDNFKELFQAVDINNDDSISVEEFTILFNLIEEGQKNQQMFISKFIETCGNSDGLSFFQFGMFCMSNQLFKKEKQDSFLQYNNDQFKQLQIRWNEQRKYS